MAIIEVWIDEDACTGCGLCEDTCPDVFEVDDVARVKEDADFNEFEEEIKEAA
ncbi:ferredoxin, partial [Candidatus Aerophobetes bacterium]